MQLGAKSIRKQFEMKILRHGIGSKIVFFRTDCTEFQLISIATKIARLKPLPQYQPSVDSLAFEKPWKAIWLRALFIGSGGDICEW